MSTSRPFEKGAVGGASGAGAGGGGESPGSPSKASIDWRTNTWTFFSLPLWYKGGYFVVQGQFSKKPPLYQSGRLECSGWMLTQHPVTVWCIIDFG